MKSKYFLVAAVAALGALSVQCSSDSDDDGAVGGATSKGGSTSGGTTSGGSTSGGTTSGGSTSGGTTSGGSTSGGSTSGGAPSGGSGGAIAGSGGAGGSTAGTSGGGGKAGSGGGGTGGGAAGASGGGGKAGAGGGGTGGGGGASGGGGKAGSGGGGAGGTAGGGAGGGGTATFAAVRTILTASCGTGMCHMGGNHVNLRDDAMLYMRLTTPLTMGAMSCMGRTLVVPGNPGMSLLYTITGPTAPCAMPMPSMCRMNNPPRMCLSEMQRQTISDWITAGAPM